MQATLRLLKQTLHPPKRTVPLAANPLTRWSRRLPQWRHLSGTLTGAAVGLEGCHSAFNATNSIRTCLFFQTVAPPTFLTAESWRAIEHVQTRPSVADTSLSSTPTSSSTSSSMTPPDIPSVLLTRKEEDPFTGLAVFGEHAFFPSGAGDGAGTHSARPIVAVENFTDRAQSVMQTRLPAALRDGGVRLVVGHENWGVRRSLLRSAEPRGELADDSMLPVADMVVYVPQYGTISSLNVVTSLGIALFYCYLDGNCPHARNLYPVTCDGATRSQAVQLSSESDLASLRDEIQAYQDFFKTSLPSPPSPSSSSQQMSADAALDDPLSAAAASSSTDGNVNTTPRVDRRPIHPVFYKQEMDAIHERQQRYRQALLRFSQATGGFAQSGSAPSFFGLSVLYENKYDQRNFGGLIRNANAFLVDRILYVGRRKYNVVGAVGSYHYTPPVYLGPLPCDGASEGEDAALSEGASWSATLKAKVDALYGAGDGSASPPQEWWLLDCGHDFLYEADSSASATATPAEDRGMAGPLPRVNDLQSFAGSPESFELYQALLAKGCVHDLCESENALRGALASGVVLLVPQEGKLPHAELMKLCTGVLRILPDGVHHSELVPPSVDGAGAEKREGGCLGHRGLPSQVASGIALQRISAVLHPGLAAI